MQTLLKFLLSENERCWTDKMNAARASLPLKGRNNKYVPHNVEYTQKSLFLRSTFA